MRLDCVEEVDSTSDALKRRLITGDAAEAALLARRQTQGRGRLGRSWQTRDGNAFLSVLLRPDAVPMPGHWAVLAAVALAETVAPHLPDTAPLRLKWPNDVLLGTGKLAGILVEAGTAPAPWLVIGFGVNLVSPPHGLERPVACLADAGAPPSPAAFAAALLARLAAWRARYAAEGFAPVKAAWLGRGHRPDEAVTLTTGQHGRFAGLDEDGALLLRAPSGRVERVVAGELT